MDPKIIILLFGFFVSILLISRSNNSSKLFFWISISLLFVRPLSISTDFAFHLSTTCFLLLIISNYKILLNKLNWKEFRYWYLVIFIGLINFFFKTYFNSHIYEINSEFLDASFGLNRSFNWSFNFFVIIMISCSILYYINSYNDLEKLKKLFFITCFIFSFTAIISFFGFYDGIIIFNPELQNYDDFSSVLKHSQIYGISHSNLVFSICAVSIVFLPFIDLRFWQKSLYFVIIVFSILISLKRVAYLSLFFALLYFAFVYLGKRRNKVIFLFIMIGFLIIVIQSAFFQLFLDRLYIDDTYTNTTRAERIAFTWSNFINNPVLGMGSGFIIYIHNYFLEILGNLGLFGIVLFQPLLKPLFKLKKDFNNPWVISLIIIMLTLFSFETALNRIEIVTFLGLLYGGFLVSINLSKSSKYE